MKSDVYFSDFRCQDGESPLNSFKNLIIKAGIDKIDFEGKYVAIKLHFGELGNTSFIRPMYVKVLVDLIKERGGKPFLTDCNTLYPGSRKNAIDHLYNAEVNGFNYMTTGAEIIIGDGLRGTTETPVPINLEYVKEAAIGKEVMDADIFISLTHFKGHDQAGFGGALKNIGMGCGSRAGKMEQHSSGKPVIDLEKCKGCQHCCKECGSDAIYYKDHKAYIDYDKCKGCGRCIGGCNFDAIANPSNNTEKILSMKISEYAYAVCKDRPCFHLSILKDISPNCDCWDGNDTPIIPDIGMFASFDPVALDQACIDAAQNETPIRNSFLTEKIHEHPEHEDNYFKCIHPNVEWEAGLEHAEKIGLGSREYNLIKVVK